MTKQVLEITQQFSFDAAHYLGASPVDSNRRIHGHSFYVEVTLRGEADSAKGARASFFWRATRITSRCGSCRSFGSGWRSVSFFVS